jgi:hypothetical protein
MRAVAAAVDGRFLIVPPSGKSLSKPSSAELIPPPPELLPLLDLSLRQPLLDEEREKERRSLKLRSSVPTGVRPDIRSWLSPQPLLSPSTVSCWAGTLSAPADRPAASKGSMAA